MNPDMTIKKRTLHDAMSVFLISFGRAFRCSQVLFVRRSSSQPSIGIPNLHEAFTIRHPVYRQISLQHAVLLRSCSLRVLPAPLRSGFLSVARLSRPCLLHLPCQLRPPSLRRLSCLFRLPSLLRLSAPPAPSPAPGPPGQLMLRRSGSFSGEAASMSICSLTI